MRRRLLLVAALAPCLFAAELKLFVVRGGIESAVTSPFDVGTVAAGSFSDTAFRVRNADTAEAWLNGLSLSGNRFSFQSLPAIPLSLRPGESAAFSVRFHPLTAGSHSAYLSVDGVTTVLRATGGEPGPADPLTPVPTEPVTPGPAPVTGPPEPAISIEPTALTGGQLARVSIQLASASPAAATGQLSVGFTPSVAGRADDSAILFSATGTRSIAFTVAAGESVARFQGDPTTEFQAGTTAGTLVFTATLGPHTKTHTAVVPAGYVVVDSAGALRISAGIQIQMTGYDTSRSTSVLSFTFFDATGDPIPPGLIQVNAALAFQNYYAATELGSLFKLVAVFPVAGDSALITAADVAVGNSLGSTQARRLVLR